LRPMVSACIHMSSHPSHKQLILRHFDLIFRNHRLGVLQYIFACPIYRNVDRERTLGHGDK
jgi:hypothetical protein